MMPDSSSDARASTSGHGAFLALALLGACAIASCTCDGMEQGHVLAPPGGDLSNTPAPRQAYNQVIASQCGELGLQPDRSGLMGRLPYMQSVSESSGTIVWTSGSETLVARVQGPETSEAMILAPVVDRSASPSQGQQYLTELRGLSPGTLYCYTITEEANESPVFTGGFRTAPGPDATVRFSAFGDLGKDSPDQHAVRFQLESFDSEFLLVMGDVGYESGTREQLESYFFAIYADFLSLVPVFPATGNHDYLANEAAAFREAFVLPTHSVSEGKERWYSFDWGPVHVAVLDTEVMLDAQAAWLREDMAASNRPWKIVSLHKPPYSSGGHGSNSEVLKILVPVFREAKVHLVLAGHDHHYERTDPIEGTHYLVSGGGGRGTRPVGSSDFTAFAARVAHFVYFVAGPATLTMHAIDATGQEFDTLLIRQ